jgi:hypothetical protein
MNQLHKIWLPNEVDYTVQLPESGSLGWGG